MVRVTVVSAGQERHYDNVVAFSCKSEYLRVDYLAPPPLRSLWNGTRPLSTALPSPQWAFYWLDGDVAFRVEER